MINADAAREYVNQMNDVWNDFEKKLRESGVTRQQLINSK